MLGEFFAISPDDDVQAYVDDGPFTRTPTVEAKTLSEVSIGSLARLLGVEEAIGDGYVLAGSGESGAFPLPDTFRDAIAAGVSDEVAARWAATEELQLDRWTAALAREVLDALQSLAREAATESRTLWFYWSV